MNLYVIKIDASSFLRNNGKFESIIRNENPLYAHINGQGMLRMIKRVIIYRGSKEPVLPAQRSLQSSSTLFTCHSSSFNNINLIIEIVNLLYLNLILFLFLSFFLYPQQNKFELFYSLL